MKPSGLLVSALAKKEDAGGKPPSSSTSDGELAAAKDMLRAFKADDPEALARALRNWQTITESAETEEV